MSLDAFRDHVERLARARNGEPIYNATIEHAAVIIEKMFAHARQQVSLLTGSLNPRVYGRDEVCQQAKLFLSSRPTTHLRILVEEDVDQRSFFENPFIRAIGNYRNAELRTIPEHMRGLFNFHFLAMDHDSYRFESDKTAPEAVAAFGDQKGAHNMNRIFGELWNFGAPLELARLQPA